MAQPPMEERWALVEHIVARVLEGLPAAAAAFAGGSFARGDATPSSDLDLVILFETLDHAWRETLDVAGTTAEIFAHDAATLRYFFNTVDLPTGMVPLAEMIAEGRNMLPSGPLADEAQSLARHILAAGPPALSAVQMNMRRYEITTALEDLTDAVRTDEILAIGATLYQALADTALRGAGRWSGSGKWLARRLRRFDPVLADALERAARLLVTDAAAGKREFAALVMRVLAPHGGLLLHGHRLDAPADWRA